MSAPAKVGKLQASAALPMSAFDYDRNAGLGASDCPAVLGISPWVSPLQLWERKTGMAPEQAESMAMRLGTALEPVVLAEFARATGLSVSHQQDRIIDQDRPWRWATLDGIASDGAIIEAKTTSIATGWGEEYTDEIPDHYIAQVHHQMAVTGLALAWVPVLIAGRDFRVYRVERDEDIIQYINREEAAFWEKVVSREAPPPRAVDAARVFNKDNGATIQATPQIALLAGELTDVRANIKELEARKDKLEGVLKLFMGEASALEFEGHTVATWKAAKDSKRFDADAFKLAQPEMYSQFQKTIPGTRRFLLK